MGDCDCAGIRRPPRARIYGRLIDQCMALGTSSSTYETGVPSLDRGRYTGRERSGAPGWSVDGVAQLLVRLERRCRRGRDGDVLAGGGVASLACGPCADGERPETGDGGGFVPRQRIGDRSVQGGHDRVRGRPCRRKSKRHRGGSDSDLFMCRVSGMAIGNHIAVAPIQRDGSRRGTQPESVRTSHHRARRNRPHGDARAIRLTILPRGGDRSARGRPVSPDGQKVRRTGGQWRISGARDGLNKVTAAQSRI